MVDARDISGKQKQIAVSEFFEKNKHFLGFDSLQRSLITAVKEAVDEAKKIQFSFLERAATLTELVLFSIQGSEHSSYKSSKNHIKHFITDGDHVILGAKDDA